MTAAKPVGTNWVTMPSTRARPRTEIFGNPEQNFSEPVPEIPADDVAKVGNEFGRVLKIHDFWTIRSYPCANRLGTHSGNPEGEIFRRAGGALKTGVFAKLIVLVRRFLIRRTLNLEDGNARFEHSGYEAAS